MSKQGFFIIWITVAAMFLLLSNCANPVSLTGGPRDEKEPSVDLILSTPNEQINFLKQDVEIYFDEFIDLRDVFNNVVISPPLNKNPKISSRGKRLTIKFDEAEVLKDDATYVINFGDAIRDFTESNILKNYRFVFSTGDYIDSLSISGKVTDVKTGKPVEDMNVMLYDNLSDTVVRTERPFYFSSTDKEGNFKIENLRADTFKLFALKDANLNYLYDQDSEAIGFLDSFIVVGEGSDTLSQRYAIESFIATPKFSVKEKIVPNFGEIKLLFTASPDSLDYKASIDGIEFIEEIDKDSLLLWYDSPIDTGFNVIVYEPFHDYHDTISVRKYKRADFLSKQSISLRSNTLASGKKLIPSEELKFKFSYPIQDFSKDSIDLIMDSTAMEFTISKDSMDERSLILYSEWLQDSSYQIIFNDGAVVDIYGHRLDSIMRKFDVLNTEILSNVHVIYSELDSMTNYLVSVLDGSKTIRESYISNSSNGKISFNQLIPKAYKLEVIRDDNGNRRWDPGNYDRKKQSEYTFTRELEKLRENWDLEVNLTYQDFIKSTAVDTTQQ